MPVIEDQVERLRSKRYFTILDLKSAFYHVDIEPSSVKYTSFVCLDQQWEFLKMPFGLRNIPATFMRYVHQIFSDLLRDKKILLYIDDIMIATETIQENLNILKQVLMLLVDNKLTIRLDKCHFLMTEITFLGYTI